MELVTKIVNANRVPVYNSTANKLGFERLTRENASLRQQVAKANAAKSAAERRKDIVEGLLAEAKKELDTAKAEIAEKAAKIDELTAALAAANKKGRKKQEQAQQAELKIEEGSSSTGA